MFTSQVKKEERTGSSLTPALSHGGAASVHTGYFKPFSPTMMTVLLPNRVLWVQTPTHLTMANWREAACDQPLHIKPSDSMLVCGFSTASTVSLVTPPHPHSECSRQSRATLISSDPENRMFPGPCSWEEEVHVSVTRVEGEEGAAGAGGGGLDFPLQPTEAQRTIQRFLWGRCQDCQLGTHSTSGISLFPKYEPKSSKVPRMTLPSLSLLYLTCYWGLLC